MAENRKAIIISTGMDNVQLLAALQESEVATGASLERVKALYAKFSEQQAMLESAKNDASLAKLKANDDLKLAEMERFFAAQRAMYEEQAAIAAVAQGSIPANMAGGMAGAGKAAGAAETAAGDAGEGIGTGAKMEGMVLVRETLRGAGLSRILSSALRLFSLLKVSLLDLGLAAGGAYLAIKNLPSLFRSLGFNDNSTFIGKNYTTDPSDVSQALSDEGANGVKNPFRSLFGSAKFDIKNTETGTTASGILKERLKNLVRHKLLPQSQADWLTKLIDSGDPDQLSKAANAINTVMPQEMRMEGIEAERKQQAATEKAEHEAATLNYQHNRLGKSPIELLEIDRKRYLQLEQSVHSSKDIWEAWDNILKDQKDITEEINKQKEAQQKITELQQQKHNIELQIEAAQQRQNDQYPELAQIARLGWRNGRRTDAGAMAHELLTLQGYGSHMGWERYNRAIGNFDLANQEAAREQYLRKTLADMGYQMPDFHMEQLSNKLDGVNAKLAGVLNVNISDVTDNS